MMAANFPKLGFFSINLQINNFSFHTKYTLFFFWCEKKLFTNENSKKKLKMNYQQLNSRDKLVK